ncbi:MAG TPA: hypothetical protein VKM94_10795 [Blastocatellia bacterium]|nr:hypothetical protein [Blastocatellia bacterium]
MKICPVCNEAFIEEMNFCDVDGTPLDRDPVVVAQTKNKLWSILGVVLLVGALGLSATVVFLPKPRPASTFASPETTSATNAKSAAAESHPTPAAAPTSPDAAASDPVAATASASEPKVRERGESAKAPFNGPAPDPKAAALSSNDGSDSTVHTKADPPVSPKSETSKASRATAPAADGEDGKSVSGSESKKESQQAQASHPGEKDSRKKPDEKKKGGFFKVFKKIFGKD